MMKDTIAAIATPPGIGGVAIIRISGSNALSVLKRVFSHKNEYEHAQMQHGWVCDGGNMLDNGYAVMFYAPRSYTGEDVAELHIHGSAAGTARVLGAVTENGARLAQPGEFSRRAFLNGKMDLTQAEAVCDYIAATSEAAAKASVRQMEGRLKEALQACQDRLTDVLAEVEAAVEYPEEDLEQEITTDAVPVLQGVKKEIDHLEETFVQGRIMKEGFGVVIAGAPNVGKSSLMNALCNVERSIVSGTPGTTRDTVEKSINLNGISINLMDTAGIRKTEDLIEIDGVKRAKNATKAAELMIFLMDVSRETSLESSEAYRSVKNNTDDVLVVFNKKDLFEGKLEKQPEVEFIMVSARTGEGIEELKERIYGRAVQGGAGEGVVITNERHSALLKKASGHLGDALAALGAGMDMDCVTIDLNLAWSALGEITGNTVSEDIIDRIFSKFCLGK